MSDERQFTLRQIDQARGDVYAIQDDLEFLRAQLARMPTRAWLSRMWLMGFGSPWAVLAVMMLLLAR